MKLQNLLLPQTGICTEEKMYYRTARGTRLLEKEKTDQLSMKKNNTVSFDTYFNSCTAEKWFKYTTVRSISLTLQLEGRFRVTLMRLEKGLDKHTTHYLCEQTVGQDGTKGTYTIPFGADAGNGLYAFELTCLSDSGRLLGGWYEGEVPPEEIRRVKLALVICTFKREMFVTRNVRVLTDCFLNAPDSGMKDGLEIFISDNARTLDKNDIVLNDWIHLFPNKNTGGAGGFTRGMIEVMKCRDEKHISHILLMDDDVIINPESLYRTFVILSLLKDAYRDAFVGGAMIRLDKQYLQHESGALWNTGNLISYKNGLDLRRTDAIIFNETEETCDYNAWWYCAFPAHVVTETNLPLPIFIRGDDVEYGLRNMKQLILMNGICVWHEPFENKYSSSMFYYIFRNRLIDNSVRRIDYRRKRFIKDLTGQVKREIVLYRYKNAELLMDGVDDFFRGIDWFMEQDGQALHQSVMGRGYKLQDISACGVPFSFSAYEQSCRIREPGAVGRKFRKFMLNGLLLPARRERDTDPPAIAPTFTARPINCYRARRVLHYDLCSKKGFVTKKSLKQTLFLMLRLYRLSIRARFRYQKLVGEYARRSGELTRLSFWNKYLDL